MIDAIYNFGLGLFAALCLGCCDMAGNLDI